MPISDLTAASDPAGIVSFELQVTIHSRKPGYDHGIDDNAASQSVSPLEAALHRVGDRWTLLIVEALLDGPSRFGDLRVAVPGVAPNILSQRLRHLEREALVVA